MSAFRWTRDSLSPFLHLHTGTRSETSLQFDWPSSAPAAAAPAAASKGGKRNERKAERGGSAAMSPPFFVCHVCNRSLKSRPVLMKHMKLHDQNRKIYTCQLCSYTCNFGFNLKRHIATVHAKQAGITTSPGGGTNNNSSLAILPSYNY